MRKCFEKRLICEQWIEKTLRIYIKTYLKKNAAWVRLAKYYDGSLNVTGDEEPRLCEIQGVNL